MLGTSGPKKKKKWLRNNPIPYKRKKGAVPTGTAPFGFYSVRPLCRGASDKKVVQ